jgi:phospholipase/carboxylesterase
MSIEQRKIGQLDSYLLNPNLDDSHPESAVILLHGYGANGRDLISLAAEWAPRCPKTIFIAPDAPTVCEATPLGRQWFSLDPFSRDNMERQIQNHWRSASQFIDAVIEEFKIVESKIILCGFSQGTMMCLYTALSRKNQCAGVLGYSGMLLGEDNAKLSPHKHIPIHLIHGKADAVVPVIEWEKSMAFFQDNGFTNITGYSSKGLAHNIDLNGIESGLYFIRHLLRE